MPTWATVLLELLKSAPALVHMVSDALRGGETPEQAIAKALAAAPEKLDTAEKDAARRLRIRTGGIGGGDDIPEEQ